MWWPLLVIFSVGYLLASLETVVTPITRDQYKTKDGQPYGTLQVTRRGRRRAAGRRPWEAQQVALR